MADVTATRFVLQDRAGRARATLEVVNDETLLTLINNAGRRFATLSESFEGDGVLYLYGGRTNAFMSLFAENGSPAIFIFDQNGKISTFDSAGVHTVLTTELEKLPKLPGVTTPSIATLEPATVAQGSTVTVKIHGSGFDSGSFALFNGAVPRTVFWSETLLEAEVDPRITGSAGTKKVKVHTAGGGLSNEVDFIVRPR